LDASSRHPRAPSLRSLYLTAALADVPRLLGAIDRNPYRDTYGSFDRQFWHYRTSAFPSEMYQEGVLPLAMAYSLPLPGNRWHRQPRVRELAIATLRFSARSCHADGSCDDYYPFERALGAAVFSLAAAARAYELLELDDAQIVRWFRLRCDWIMSHDESGRLANHHALAALGLLRVARLLGDRRYREAADDRLLRVLGWQNAEGWFEEYGGADPGYQTVTIDCLAKYRQVAADVRLDEPLRRAVDFARHFLQPDGSYGGVCGSRGTHHFYPHGMELLAAEDPNAADMADGFLQSLAAGTRAYFSDDRLVAHYTANFLEAYLDWSPNRPPPLPANEDAAAWFPQAGLLVRQIGHARTTVSTSRGGVFTHFAAGRPMVADAGLIAAIADGRIAVSQTHDRNRPVERSGQDVLTVRCPLHRCRFETATVGKQALLHLAMSLVGRFLRTLVRRLLQRRLITGRQAVPIRLTRRFEWLHPGGAGNELSLRVVDTIELTDPTLRVRRMAFGSDHQSAYVAATGVYQDSALSPWTDLSLYVEELNNKRSVEIVREYP
jgi:hypothetical protein